jgi:lipopolysaccharide heptosyltransferase II
VNDGSGLVIRSPNHLGDLVMALPTLALVPAADVLVPRSLAPLLALADRQGSLIPFEHGRAGFLPAVRALRRFRPSRAILMTPSFAAALVVRVGGVPERRGLDTGGRRLLLTDPVPQSAARGRHRTALYHLLLTGEDPVAGLVPTLAVPETLRAQWRERLGRRRPFEIGLFPGGNAGSRRWFPERFAEVAARLARQGARVVVFGGPHERALTRTVAGAAAVDAGGTTDLPLLAAALSECDILVTNDSGPLHLAAAVGTPTISLWGAGDPAETGVMATSSRMLRRPDLPCVPCVKNECPRTGPGYLLPEAERECLRLIDVKDVLEALGRPAPR